MAQVGALRDVPPDEAVLVLVAASFAWRVRVAVVDLGALSGDLMPDVVDLEKKCATFVGGGGDKYATTLIGCTCPDFVEREKPCKHMYWLAHELGVDDGEE